MPHLSVCLPRQPGPRLVVQGRSISPRTVLEAHALRGRGWSISAIAHLKTIRAYLSRAREPGVQRKSVPDLIDPFGVVPHPRLSRAALVARLRAGTGGDLATQDYGRAASGRTSRARVMEPLRRNGDGFVRNDTGLIYRLQFWLATVA